MSQEISNLLDVTRQELDQVSPSFCLAKWTQVTIHLNNGTNHSCHHPIPHKIPLKEILQDPSALHHTSRKKEERQKMLQGIRPAECDYCWRIEDSAGSNVSDRILKSSQDWSLPFIQEILKNPLSNEIMPRYVEINIGDKCNFKCSYCGPEVSSRWMSEIQQHGPYPTADHYRKLQPSKMPIPENQANPYLDAWWKWWPELYPHLHTFRITGGEPLLNKEFYKTLDWVEKQANPSLTLAINTNLCPPEDLWQKFLEQIRLISESDKIRRLEIYTSAEAWGDKAEYIRFGMDFELWRKRLWELLEKVPKANVTVMATYNALSVTSFDLLLQEILRVKRHEPFYNQHRHIPIVVDVSYLRHPSHQSIKVLPRKFARWIKSHVELMEEQSEKVLDDGQLRRGFMSFETRKMARILNWFLSKSDSLDRPWQSQKDRGDFYLFFSEHDRRRGTDFLKTFPEFKTLWLHCQLSKVTKSILNAKRFVVGLFVPNAINE